MIFFFILSLLAAPSRGQDFPSFSQKIEQGSNYEVFQVTFPSVARSPHPESGTVWVRLYKPLGAPRAPYVVLLPILAGPNLWIEERFARALLNRGIGVALVELPYQFHRRPQGKAETADLFLGRSPKTAARNFRQAAGDVRRTVDWLLSREIVESKRVGLLGISLGAMVGATVYAQDERVRAAVFLLGGADFPSLVVKSALTAKTLRRLSVDEQDVRARWKGLEPSEYPLAAERRALLINARWDRIIPRENALKLKEAFPKSRQMWVPFGHYSSIVHIFWIRGAVARHFQENL